MLLHSRIVEGTLGFSPRPVFHEELDLLGLNKLGWNYPHCEEPLLWAINKQYFYRGTLVFEAKGANIYDEATVVFQPGQEALKLKPVDVKRMLKRNADLMFLLESEAIEFIHETYEQYASARKTVKAAVANTLDFEALAAKAEKRTKQKMAIVKEDCDSFDIVPLKQAEHDGKRVYQTTKIDKFIASFSGGKDSQVVLDLCTRAIPSTDFEVIYSDTGYELPPSLQLYDRIQEQYHESFPDLKFSVARNHESVLNYWDKIGTPSDKHRWCCAVMKTAPLYRTFKTETGKQDKVLTFDGVRAEESTRRSSYERIGKGVKHDTVINARPILHWSTAEVFLYIFAHHLYINPAYRQGMTRVGCLICPFGNEWNEMIVQKHYHSEVSPFLSKLETYAKKGGIKDVSQYIKDGGWKRRASGNLVDRKAVIDFKYNAPIFQAKISNPKLPIETFLTTLGVCLIQKEAKGSVGEIRIKGVSLKFKITEEGDSFHFEVANIQDAVLVGALKRALLKSTYCVQCEACEVECPTGALRILPTVSVDASKCVHCHKCLDFHDRGCIAANSLYMTTGSNKVANIDRYKNFGLKEEWVEDYFVMRDDFWESNHGLHEIYQVPSLKNWLKDAEIIDKNNKITELGNLLADIKMDEPDLVWEIIWINLVYNSFIANWYAIHVKTSMPFTAKALEEEIRDEYPTYKEKTVHNAVYQIQRTLKESPIGSTLQQLEVEGKTSFKRNGHEELSAAALAYSLYKYAQTKGVYSLRLADLISEDATLGVYKEFRSDRSVLIKKLQELNSATNRIVIAELNNGLDSISLRSDISALDSLRISLNL